MRARKVAVSMTAGFGSVTPRLRSRYPLKVLGYLGDSGDPDVGLCDSVAQRLQRMGQHRRPVALAHLVPGHDDPPAAGTGDVHQANELLGSKVVDREGLQVSEVASSSRGELRAAARRRHRSGAATCCPPAHDGATAEAGRPS